MVQVFAFHLMPYLDIPDDFKEKYGSAWITMPNSHYDPEKGHQYYHQFFDQLELADRLGFDGVCVNEHHQTAYGNMPAPNVIAALLARHIKNGKIAIVGNAISLHSIPQRIAEEVAILDVVTEGRIISGFVRGIGAEYHSYRNINPSESKERFFEAHDIIKRAWTEEGPFEFKSRHYHFPYVNVWPRPFQKPHPPIWCPTQGSKDTVEFAAKNKYTLLQTFTTKDDMKVAFDRFREMALKYGYEASPLQLGFSHHIYVSDTDEKAWEEYAEHHKRFNDLFHMPNHMKFPPGYVNERAMKAIVSKIGTSHEKTLQQAFDDGMVTVGSPETVRQRLTELQKELGFGILNAHMHKGNMPHWKAMKNIDLFGRYVLPHIQKLGTEAAPVAQSSN